MAPNDSSKGIDAEEESFANSCDASVDSMQGSYDGFVINGFLPEIKREFMNMDVSALDTFNILSIGAGNGQPDVAILKELMRQLPEFGTLKISYTVVEQSKLYIEKFQARVKENKHELQNVEFIWINKKIEEFTTECNYTHKSFHCILIIYALFYMDDKMVLDTCMSNLLAPYGVLILVVVSEEDMFSRAFDAFHNQINGTWIGYHNLVAKDIEIIAAKREWNYRCSKANGKVDMTDVFNPSSRNGSLLLDFLFHTHDLRSRLSPSQWKDIVQFMKKETTCEKIKDESRFMRHCVSSLCILKLV